MENKKEKSSLAKVEGGEALAELTDEQKAMYEEDSKENLVNIDDAFYQLSIKGSRFRIDNEFVGDNGLEFTGVIIREVPMNIFYRGKYDPENTEKPDCFSVGGLKPDSSVENPCHTNCADCPNNQWDTGTNAKGEPSGKACSNKRKVVISVPGMEMPIVLSIPATSLQNFNGYLKKLSRQEPSMPLAAVATTISFDPATTDFPRLTFDIAGILSPGGYKEMKELRSSEAIEKVLYSFSSEDKSKDEEKGSGAEVKSDQM